MNCNKNGIKKEGESCTLNNNCIYPNCMKQETLEEAAEIFVNNRFAKQITGNQIYPDIYASKKAIIESHILFAKWQTEKDKQIINSLNNTLNKIGQKHIDNLFKDKPERMYSEEEVIEIIDKWVRYQEEIGDSKSIPLPQFIEQLKKK
jgi:hypothetical protein